MDDGKNIESDIQKMNRPPNFLGNIFPRVGSRNQDYHQIETDCSKRDKQWFVTRVKGNENIREVERDEFVKKKTHSVNKGKKKRLKRNPAMEIETAKAQEIFSYSRQTGNRASENGNIEQ